MNILVTGCAGFIGYHLTNKLLLKNNRVIGVDNLNNYYDKKLKIDRLKDLKLNFSKKKFNFYKGDITNFSSLKKIFKKHNVQVVINLAAQAGVRYSLKKPRTYIDNNIVGFFNIIELSKQFRVKHLLFASTSSIYGKSKKFPIDESLSITKPLQLYAATKAANELIAHSYSHIYKMNITGLRFFTVYGPWGRPDMSLFIFVQKILQKKKLPVFNHGNHVRDFTYIDDVVNGIVNAINYQDKKNLFRVFNIGNGKPIGLKKFINLIEKNLKLKGKMKLLKLQKGDTKKTHASIKLAKKKLNFYPKTPPKIGVSKFIKWFLSYYKFKRVSS